MYPDYHNSFLLRDQLRKIGWKADIFVPDNYPEVLMYSKEDLITRFGAYYRNHSIRRICFFVQFLYFILMYKNHVYFGKLPNYFNFPRIQKLLSSDKNDFVFHLYIARLFRVNIIYVPSGCLDEFTKVEFSLFDKNNVCNNCGSWDVCNDRLNILNFNRVRRYSSLNIGSGAFDSPQFIQKTIRYRSLDLNLWSPDLEIPDQYQRKSSHKFTIMHSYLDEGRTYLNRNIKGTPYIKQAVEDLIKEGFDIELLLVTGIPIADMRFLQSQADLIIDELIYGWHGSTSIEALCLGVPVICYLREESINLFRENFPNLPDIPIINANTLNLTDVLRSLLSEPKELVRIAKDSREFAKLHFDLLANTEEFATVLGDLSNIKYTVQEIEVNSDPASKIKNC
jgi:hypothetical protein